MKTKFQLISFVLFILSLAILLTIYGAWLFYPGEISWLGIARETGLKSSLILKNFHILMNYLTNPFQATLSMPDFPSSAAGLHHFEQVKWLFHLVQLIFLVSLLGAFGYMKAVVKSGYLTIHRRLFAWLMLVPLLLAAVVVVVGFESFFILFHQILFAGDQTWLFDPAKDPVILILPELFFLHCFALFLFLYELGFGICYWLSRRAH